MNRTQALDILYGDALAAIVAAGIDQSNIFWDNVERPDGITIPEAQVPFAQVYMRHVSAPVRGFGGPRGARLRYVEKGVAWIKLHVPNAQGTDHAAVTQAVLSHYRAIRLSKVSYANIRAVEDGKHGLFYVTDFQANFSYDVFN